MTEPPIFRDIVGVGAAESAEFEVQADNRGGKWGVRPVHRIEFIAIIEIGGLL